MKSKTAWLCAAPSSLALAAAPDVAQAQEGLDSGDTAWMLVSTALVLFMTLPGLAMFYGGLVRTKNVLSVLMQCLVLTALITLLWLAGVYSLAFGEGGALVGGLERAWLLGVTGDTARGTIPEVLFFVYQLTFAIITPALIIGAYAERMRFAAVLAFSGLWLVLVYAPICHMTWGGGLFAPGGMFGAERGVFDFAGGIVVHITAGVAALVACIVVGPREGYPRRPMPPHNLTMTFTGTAMLWVGWFGFNAGSALSAGGGAAMALAVTHISASAATLTWMAVEWIRHGKPSLLGAATGSIAGLAAITPASGYVGPLGGLVIGVVAGALCWYAATSVKRRVGYDDSLDVFGVHGVGGFLGTALAGALASDAFGGNQVGLAIAPQLGVQLVAAAIAVGYTALASFVILKLVGAVIPLRVDEAAENQGLDLSEHEESGYMMAEFLRGMRVEGED
jgi:Amt family ammonium transporter